MFGTEGEGGREEERRGVESRGMVMKTKNIVELECSVNVFIICNTLYLI
jgi:hypothetical protein